MIGATAPFLIEISRQKAYHISMQKKVRKAIKRYGSSSDLISKIKGKAKESVKEFNKAIDHSKRKLIINIDEALDSVFDEYAKCFLAKRTISYEEV